MSEQTVNAKEFVTQSLEKLTRLEEKQLEKAANGKWAGGDPVTGPTRASATALSLVYKCTARLRPFVLKELRGELGVVEIKI